MLHNSGNIVCRAVSLDISVIVHSGVAVGMLLRAIESGQVDRSLGIEIADNFSYGCLHCEGSFTNFLVNEAATTWRNRMDNMNNCLRAWGTDFRATTETLGVRVRSSLHPQLRHFVAVGVASSPIQSPFIICSKLSQTYLEPIKTSCFMVS